MKKEFHIIEDIQDEDGGEVGKKMSLTAMLK